MTVFVCPHGWYGERASRSVQFLRASAIRDLQRSDELSKLIFSFLFALVAIGASVKVMLPGTGRIAAWLLAAALLVKGITGVILVIRRWRGPSTASILEFIRMEHHQAEARLRFERYSQWFTAILAAVALVLVLFTPRPVTPRENALEKLERAAVMIAFLAVAWRGARFRSGEVRRDLERSLRDLAE